VAVAAAAAVEIPPGSYLSQNLVRPCPKGRYREGIAGVEEEAGATPVTLDPQMCGQVWYKHGPHSKDERFVFKHRLCPGGFTPSISEPVPAQHGQ
jgi:hypothetical protein